jgi:hypothetical protein
MSAKKFWNRKFDNVCLLLGSWRGVPYDKDNQVRMHKCNVADPDHFDPYPDPAFHFYPDPTFLFNTYRTFLSGKDSDPAICTVPNQHIGTVR